MSGRGRSGRAGRIFYLPHSKERAAVIGVIQRAVLPAHYVREAELTGGRGRRIECLKRAGGGFFVICQTEKGAGHGVAGHIDIDQMVIILCGIAGAYKRRGFDLCILFAPHAIVEGESRGVKHGKPPIAVRYAADIEAVVADSGRAGTVDG